ncbi:alpha-2-macroglobulin-like [Chiloscyllium plagiosum]|uniref:alpha-2-macroglobulin-like n=1 Tax=Chiloscyllium plagiosum TaxID=36176 RepID=UPI001CB7CDF9|nr:alpha-2-macroglobulin-like [Chiloscyllium plagiosum]
MTFDLMREPLLGTYEIEGMQNQRRQFHHNFSVEEYVLPTAELKVKMPKQITIFDTTIHIEVCGRYTYGKPVRGQVNGTVCLGHMTHDPDPILCQIIVGEMDLNGCLSTDVSTDVFPFRERPNQRLIDAQFVLTEEGTASEGHFQLSLPVRADLSPIARLLVFATLPGGEITGDSANFQVSQCFQNKVSLHFSVAEDLPKSHISLNLHAEPNSLCGLRVVDRSVLLLKPETELTQGSIYSLLPVQDLQNYSNDLKSHEEHYCKLQDPFSKPEPSGLAMGDLGQLLKDMGLQILTDTEFHKPTNCFIDKVYDDSIMYMKFFDAADYLEMDEMSVIAEEMLDASNELNINIEANKIQPPRRIIEIRKYFPETWIWDLVPVR